MPRVPDLDPAALTDAQRRVYDMIASGPRGVVRGPLAVWLNRPGLAEPAQALGQYCRYDSSLSTRLSELAILVLARHWNSEFEWWAHKAHALKAGLPIDIIDAIRDRQPPPFTSDTEAVVVEFVSVLHAQRGVPDNLYARAVALLGQDGVIDLVGIAGYYTLISMTINVFDVRPPEGEPTELA
jgi:4-carboxymuconolactone decarboxylase